MPCSKRMRFDSILGIFSTAGMARFAIPLSLVCVARRIFHTLALWSAFFLICATAMMPVALHAAEGIDITDATLESSEDSYTLSANISFELTRGLEDVITRGVPLYFTTEVIMTRPRWYWFDEKAIAASRTVRISYNVLTHQFHVSISGRLQQTFTSLDDALSLIRKIRNWQVADKGALKPGETYDVAIRMGLDVARLPKPFQVHALNSSDWRFSSDWKHFTYRAD